MQTPPSFSVPSSVPNLGPPPGVVRFAAISEAWAMMRQDFLPWVIVMVVILGISQVFQVLMQFGMMPFILATPPSSDPAQALRASGGMFVGFGLMMIVIQVVQNVLTAMPMRFGVLKLRGQTVGVNDMFSFAGSFGRLAAWWSLYFVAAVAVPGIVVGIAAAAGGGLVHALNNATFLTMLIFVYILWLVAFIFCQCVFAFVPLLIVDQKMTVIAAARLSSKTLIRHVFPLFGILVCASFLSALGICACGLGILATGPLLYATISVVYNDFFRQIPVGQEYSGWYPRPVER